MVGIRGVDVGTCGQERRLLWRGRQPEQRRITLHPSRLMTSSTRPLRKERCPRIPRRPSVSGLSILYGAGVRTQAGESNPSRMRQADISKPEEAVPQDYLVHTKLSRLGARPACVMRA